MEQAPARRRLPPDLSQQQLRANQHEAEARCEQLADDIKLKQEEAYQKGALSHNITVELRELEQHSRRRENA